MLKFNQLIAIIFLVLIILPAANDVEAHAEYEIISTEVLAKKLENGEDLSLINVLPKIVHDAKHIEGSINIPIGKIESSKKLPKDKHKLLIFYCMGTLWVYSPKAASLATKQGYDNVMVYRRGILGWAKSGRPLSSNAQYPEVNVPIVSSLALQEIVHPRPVVLDVRPKSHFMNGHIQDSINIDLEDLDHQIDQLPKNRPIVIVDHKGKLTVTTGRYLFSKGFKKILRLDGGFNAWVKNGMPVAK